VLKCHCCSSEQVKKSGRFSNRNRIVQRFQCLRCGKTFSESQPLDGGKLEIDKGLQIVHQLCEGVGIRAASRLCGVSPRAVLSVLESAGQHCRDFLDYRMRGLRPSHVEIDEIWTFVHKKQYHAINHPVFGDQYCWLSFDQPTKLILNWLVSKRSKEATFQFIGDLRSRTTGDMT
jgi:transposase-like protein